jgi:putative glutamine amidotransferase
LRQLAETDSAPVNSHHHQAIENLGRELVATAWASDGLVEAVEDPRSDRYVVGVQWHPEIAWERDPLSQALFTRFVDEARSFASKTKSEREAAVNV